MLAPVPGMRKVGIEEVWNWLVAEMRESEEAYGLPRSAWRDGSSKTFSVCSTMHLRCPSVRELENCALEGKETANRNFRFQKHHRVRSILGSP